MPHANRELFRRWLLVEGIISVVLMICWVTFVSVSLTPGLVA